MRVRDTRLPVTRVQDTRVQDMIAQERRRAADMLAKLTTGQLWQQSLCTGWTVHDVAAHLASYLRFGRVKLYLGLLRTAADIDRINVLLTAREARRPSHEIIDQLRRRAGELMAIPGSGYEPVLADIVVHDLDIRIPLGIPRETPEERLWVAFRHLTAAPALGFAMGSRLRGLRVVATDTGWARGDGPDVRGTAEAVLLAVTGRPVPPGALAGDGAPILLHRVAARATPAPRRRVADALAILVRRPGPAGSVSTA